MVGQEKHTPLPWHNGLKGYSITGPTTPSVPGPTVHEQLEYDSWRQECVKAENKGRAIPDAPRSLHTVITVGKRTIAIVVWEPGKEEEGHANAELICRAVNAHHQLMEALEMVRDADEDCRRDGLPSMNKMAREKIESALKLGRAKS